MFNRPTHAHSKLLEFLIVAYVTVLLMSNWFDPRIVHFFGLTTDAGTLIFPLTYLLADVITEVYGYKNTRRAIWMGFAFNMLFLLYGQLVIHMPSPSFATNNTMFTTIMMADARIILAAYVSYLVAEPLNAYIIAKLKVKSKGKNMWLRFIASTAIASGVDTPIFTLVAFYGTISGNNLFSMIVMMWFIKVAIEVLGLPLSLYCANKVKKIEKVDVYDTNTDFTLFSLDSEY